MTPSLAAAFSFGSTGSVFGVNAGELRITTTQTTAVTARATAMITCAVSRPNHRTNRGVKNADSAVPTMPAPNTPVAKPRRGFVPVVGERDTYCENRSRYSQKSPDTSSGGRNGPLRQARPPAPAGSTPNRRR